MCADNLRSCALQRALPPRGCATGCDGWNFVNAQSCEVLSTRSRRRAQRLRIDRSGMAEVGILRIPTCHGVATSAGVCWVKFHCFRPKPQKVVQTRKSWNFAVFVFFRVLGPRDLNRQGTQIFTISGLKSFWVSAVNQPVFSEIWPLSNGPCQQEKLGFGCRFQWENTCGFSAKIGGFSSKTRWPGLS